MDHSHTSRRPSRSFVRLLDGGGYMVVEEEERGWTEGAPPPSNFFYSSKSTCRNIATARACVWEMRRRRFSDIDFAAAISCSLFSTAATTALYL